MFRCQIKTMLIQWQQLQQQNTRNMQPKQQESEFICRDQGEQSPLDDFDRIMDEDLENQLKELEKEEAEQYELLTQSLEKQFQQDDSTESIQELEQTCKEQMGYAESLKQFEANEQQKQYGILVKALEECECQEAQPDVWKVLEQNIHPSNKKPWFQVNPFQLRRQQEEQRRLLLAKKQKRVLQMQLQWIKANQKKTKQIIDLVESYWKNKEI